VSRAANRPAGRRWDRDRHRDGARHRRLASPGPAARGWAPTVDAGSWADAPSGFGSYDPTMTDQTPDPAWIGNERTTLTGFLEDQRSILAWKCQGLSDGQLRAPSVPPSTLTLLGLVRHMAEVERTWFRPRLSGEPIGRIWRTDAQPHADFDGVVDADVPEAFSRWREECLISRSILKDLDSLDVVFSTPDSAEMSARCLVNHMIEEDSRHNGHADLIRERIDGKTGDFPSPEEQAHPPGQG